MLDINKFFQNVEYIRGQQRTNVIYLTTACNLQCDYCYEGKKREGLEKQQPLTFDQVDECINEIASREANTVSTVVIMGGEPFLEFNRLVHVFEKAKTLYMVDGKKWAFTITTNGTNILSEFLEVIQAYRKYFIINFEISYDGSGHDRRVFPNGKSSRSIVEKHIFQLKKENFPFCISYTVHKDNHKNLLYDMVRILETMRPEAISLSIACQELDDIGVSYKTISKDFEPYAEELFRRYGIPICDAACKVCKSCDKSKFVGNTYMSPTTGLTYEEKDTQKEFSSF